MRCMSGDYVCCICVMKAMCVTLLCVRWTRLGARTLTMRCMSGDYVCCVCVMKAMCVTLSRCCVFGGPAWVQGH